MFNLDITGLSEKVAQKRIRATVIVTAMLQACFRCDELVKKMRKATPRQKPGLRKQIQASLQEALYLYDEIEKRLPTPARKKKAQEFRALLEHQLAEVS